ncbi:MAG: tRNA (adenosine(37)-N6)-threonylcarbamoyltransferase complex dimerization subunit type 1 TsaB [Cyclobacteriaceae bacterium]
MALILSIETSTDVCSVALHNDGVLIGNQVHNIEKSHSSLLPGIAEDVLRESKLKFEDLEAVAVSAGPGSYTGLRIGVTNAKGFCYAMSIPLIAIGTLDLMIQAVHNKFNGKHYLCPMLDARRMEVYTKLVDQDLNEVLPLHPEILEETTFADYQQQSVYVFGNGMPKFREIANQDNLIFIDDIFPDAANMGGLAFEKFQSDKFEDMAYFEPDYLKEWRTTKPKKQLL